MTREATIKAPNSSHFCNWAGQSPSTPSPGRGQFFARPATLIPAPTNTINGSKERDHEYHSVGHLARTHQVRHHRHSWRTADTQRRTHRTAQQQHVRPGKLGPPEHRNHL